MKAKKRRTVPSLWMDSVRRERAAMNLRRSVQENRINTEPPTAPDCTANTQEVEHNPPSANQDVPDCDSSELDGSNVPPIRNSREDVAQTQQDEELDQEDKIPNDCSRDYDKTNRERSCSDLNSTFEQNDEQDINGVESFTNQVIQFQPFQTYEGIIPQAQETFNDTPPNHCDGRCSEPIIANSPTCEQEETDRQQGTQTTLRAVRNGDEEEVHSGIPDVDRKGTAIGRLFRVWKYSLSLNALLAVVGNVRFTVQQYNYSRDSIRDAGANPTWPPYARTQRYFQEIIETCMPRSEVLRLPKAKVQTRTLPSNNGDNVEDPDIDHEESGCPDLDFPVDGSTAQTERQGEEIIRVFLPSSWAQLDVATAIVFDKMFPSFERNYHPSTALEMSPLIRGRASITKSCNSIFLKSGSGQEVWCGPGSSIAVSVQGEAPEIQSNYEISETAGAYVMKALIVSCWAVGSSDQENYSAEDVLGMQSRNPIKRYYHIFNVNRFRPGPSRRRGCTGCGTR